MNYREYQQVMKLGASGKKETCAVRSPLSSPVSSPKLVPHCNNNHNNYKIQKKTKITRSKTGCLCCRRRRKKCDEVHPKCGGCTRNFLDCCWPEMSSPQQEQSLSSDDEIPALFNNKIMIIQDEHLVTKSSNENNFIITLIKSSSVGHVMNDQFKEFPKAISILSLLN